MVEGFDGNDDRIVRTMAPGPARGVVVRRPRGGGLPVRHQGSPAARPWEATGSMDVEALAVWAYRDQRVDRSGMGGLYAAEAEAMGYEPRGRSSDGCAVLADIAHMGCRVQGSGVIVRDLVHPVAEAVAHAVEGVDGGALVRHYARQAGRPDGWASAPCHFPIAWIRPGEAHWETADDGRARFCPIITVGGDLEVARSRADYVRWWEALDALAWQLSMRALGFVVLRSPAPREPWVEVTA